MSAQEIYTFAQATDSLDGEVSIPGSKSYTNRALIIASLAKGMSTLLNVSPSNDSSLLIQGLQKLGVPLRWEGSNLHINGQNPPWPSRKETIDIGPAGTTMRFLLSVCALLPSSQVILQGTERMHQRPIQDLVDAWRELEVPIDYLGLKGCPPIKIHGQAKFTKREVSLKGNISSQFLSSILLVSPYLPQPFTIRIDGELSSRSYVEMTTSTMEKFGVRVKQQNNTFMIDSPTGYQAQEFAIEGDATGCSYLWGLAAISGGRVRVHNISIHSQQGDIEFLQLLKRMGCTVRSGSQNATDWVEVSGPSELQSIKADMSQMPDSAQTLAVLASVAKGTTTITGLHTLRHKETDRLLALQQELQKLGITSQTTEDSISIEGGQPRSASIRTYEDHRMAMSFAMLAARLKGIQIQEPQVVEKSFPNFWEVLKQLGVTHT